MLKASNFIFCWLVDVRFLPIYLVQIDCHRVKEKPHSGIVCSLKQAFQFVETMSTARLPLVGVHRNQQR